MARRNAKKQPWVNALLLCCIVAVVGWNIVIQQTINTLRTQHPPTLETVHTIFNTEKQDMQHQLDTLQKKLDLLYHKIHLFNQPEQDWILYKVRNLLLLAQYNTEYMNTRDTTLHFLREAQQLLSTPIMSMDVKPVQEAILAEIDRLEHAPVVDITTILSMLNNLESAIPKLSSAHFPTLPESSSEAASITEKAKQQLARLFIIQHTDPKGNPTYSYHLDGLYQASILIDIQEAELALLGHNPSVYAFALQHAAHHIQDYFGRDPRSKALITQLENIQHQAFMNLQPMPNTAMQLLNAYMQSHVAPNQAAL
jgi:uncharacterized protein HemX